MQEIENSLPIGTKLDDRYLIESILGEGGFGITYKAHDEKLACDVAIKEYLPTECCARTSDSISVQPRTNRGDDYQYGLKRFLEEARTLAKFQHGNIVRVSNFIEQNGTAYLVMDYAEGIPLDEWLKKNPENIDEKSLLDIITPLLTGLAEVHKAGLMHRDIKPGNIFLREKSGPLLIDFGAARQALGEHSKSISAIISMGYAPPEQYTTRGKQGAYTDLYAVGAVMYKLITGNTPVESPDRSHAIHEGDADPLTPAIEIAKGKYSDWLLQITDQLLNISPKQRPQSAESVIEAIQNKAVVDINEETTTQVQSSLDDNKTRVVKSGERFEKKTSTKAAPETDSQNKTALIAAIFMVIAIIAGGSWWFNQNNKQQIPTPIVEKNTQINTLAVGSAILYINSTPSGATVYLDNIKIGLTPYKGDALPSGKHQLKLVHTDYQDEAIELNLQNDIILKKSYTLNYASGNLSVFSQPEGARIYIDGKDTKQKTPATVMDVKAGKRHLKLHKDKYYDLSKIIHITKGSTLRSDHKLNGGNLVKYKGEWLEPKEKQQKLADAKRHADEKEIIRIYETKRKELAKKAAAEKEKLDAKIKAKNIALLKKQKTAEENTKKSPIKESTKNTAKNHSKTTVSVVNASQVRINTSFGPIEIELFRDKAPESVKNFLSYVDAGFYNGTIFHRVIKNFMIQGGGYTQSHDKKNTRAAITNEADNGLKNRRGTIAMARTNIPHSATAQFFINTKDNDFLNFTAKTTRGWGYAVFARVINGMDTVDKIDKVKTGAAGSFSRDAPAQPIVINSIDIIK